MWGISCWKGGWSQTFCKVSSLHGSTSSSMWRFTCACIVFSERASWPPCHGQLGGAVLSTSSSFLLPPARPLRQAVLHFFAFTPPGTFEAYISFHLLASVTSLQCLSRTIHSFKKTVTVCPLAYPPLGLYDSGALPAIQGLSEVFPAQQRPTLLQILSSKGWSCSSLHPGLTQTEPPLSLLLLERTECEFLIHPEVVLPITEDHSHPGPSFLSAFIASWLSNKNQNIENF